MAQLRRGHSAPRGSGGHMVRLLLMAIFIFAGIFYIRQLFTHRVKSQSVNDKIHDFTSDSGQPAEHSAKGQIISHQFFTLSYLEKYEQAEWVSYELTKSLLQKPNVKRTDWFEEDKKVSTGSARHSDYKGSGYTRGHLVPAGDMAFNETAMKETFYMSNMSPQIRSFNNGVWRELEEQVRDWVYQNGSLHIVSGPLISQHPQRLKRGNVAVPEAFFKIVLDFDQPEQKGIAFLIPHQKSEAPLQQYMISIDSLEAITGLNFFTNLDSNLIDSLERDAQPDQWPVSKARYQLRISRWNNE